MVNDGERELSEKVALVAGATRGAGRAIAVELGRAGAHVYATGRSSRLAGRSEIDRPETIEETGELVEAAGGSATALVVDHEDSGAVAALVERIESDHGRLDVLVNDMFGGDRYAQWDKPLWEHDLPGGLRMLRMGVDTHLITAHHALPLMLKTASETTPGLVVEMTDGTFEFNANFRERVGFYYDLVKANVQRIVVGLTFELREHPVVALAVTPGWLRSEKMLENFGVTPKRRGATRWRSDPGSVSVSPPRTWGGPWPRSPATPTRGGTPAARSRRTTWRRSTASPIPTALSRTAGATSTRTGSTSRADEEWKSSGRPRAPGPHLPSRPTGGFRQASTPDRRRAGPGSRAA